MNNTLQHFVAYGCFGLLLEVFFTGIWSVLHRNYRATCQTYLWMAPIYGVAGLYLQMTHDMLVASGHSRVYQALVYLLIIYGIEFFSGYILRKLIGRCPWDYGLSHWTPMGLINLKYAPYWLALSFCFDTVASVLDRIVKILSV